MRGVMTILLLTLLQLQPGLAQTKQKFGNYEMITQAQMRDYLEFIASDELEGRDTPSRGLDIAAKFIATNLSRWGVEPAGDDGTYFQKIEMKQSRVLPSETVATLNGKEYRYGKDFIVSGESADIDGSLCFASHGWYIPSKNINPYEKLDIKDKFVIVYEGFPKGITFRDLNGKFGVDFMPPSMYASQHGAKGIIYVPGYQALAFWERLSKNPVERGRVTFVNSSTDVYIPQITVSVEMLTDLFQGERVPAQAVFNNTDTIEPFTLLPQKRLKLSLKANTERLYTRNVIGIVRGSDPKLSSEYVALGAHYDHVGIGNPIDGDAIYNGADDDGSGTVALMAMAEAFAKGIRPKRSLLFVWHTAEEKGLRGSDYFVEHPTVPLQQIVAQLNIDMIGRSRVDDKPANQNLSGKDEVYVIGSRMLSTELGNLSEQVNRAFLNLTFNYKYDDPADPNRFFYRSDHYNYARKGIPIIFYFSGVHEDYHRPSDHIEKIDFQKMEKITRTIYATALELGNRPTRPIVDKPGAQVPQ